MEQSQDKNKQRRTSAFKGLSLYKGEYRLKIEKNSEYAKVFFDALIPHKMEIFIFIRSYYRCFMQGKETSHYPTFTF